MKFKKYAALVATVSASALFAQEVVTPAAVAPEAPVTVVEEVETPIMEEANTVAASAGVDVASAAVYRDGCKLSDSLVIQPNFSVGFSAFDAFPLELGVWANYATDAKDDGATQNHCFTEVDLSIGTAFDLGNDTELSVSLVTWQYPNMVDWNGEEVIIVSIAKTIGLFEVGSDFEKMLSGDCEYNFDMYPYVSVLQDVTENVSVGLKACCNYSMTPSWAGADGWTAYTLTASVSAFNFTAYATYYGQMNDKFYTDEMYDDVNSVFGINYSVDL